MTRIKLAHITEVKKRTHGYADSCIATLAQALNDSGFQTEASCCGHGHRPGNIILEDGRELFIASSYKEGRKIDKIFNNAGYKSISGEEINNATQKCSRKHR